VRFSFIGAIKYPQKMPTGANGQNQAPPAGWPTWPHSRVCTLPDKASPSISQIQPPPRMGPAPQSLSWEVGPIAGNPAPGTTFPAGHYIDGLGNVVTPTRVIGGLGNQPLFVAQQALRAEPALLGRLGPRAWAATLTKFCGFSIRFSSRLSTRLQLR
jgi:hypothetical protein